MVHLKKYIPFAISDYISKGMDLELNTWCGPEAQVASLSDDIAYFSHDIEDELEQVFLMLKMYLKNLQF